MTDGACVLSKVRQRMEKQQALVAKVDLRHLADWNRRVEGYREHIAIDGSVKGVSGRECGMWLGGVAARRRQKKKSGGMLSAARCWLNWKCAELRAFTVAVAGLFGPSTIHTDSMGIANELWRREEGGI